MMPSLLVLVDGVLIPLAPPKATSHGAASFHAAAASFAPLAPGASDFLDDALAVVALPGNEPARPVEASSEYGASNSANTVRAGQRRGK